MALEAFQDRYHLPRRRPVLSMMCLKTSYRDETVTFWQEDPGLCAVDLGEQKRSYQRPQ